MKTQRYYVQKSYAWENSYNVIDSEQTNSLGNPWVEDCALTYDEAVAKCENLNRETKAYTTADFPLGQPQQKSP